VRVCLIVNGRRREAEAWEGESLLYFLRERLGLFGSKNACEQGECGSCSVIMDGSLVCACLVLAAAADGRSVTTVEGLAADPLGQRVQAAMVEAGGVQCGFCTPGFVVACKAFLDRHPHPNPEEIRRGLSGNLCRCGTYEGIRKAIAQVAQKGA
jgi:aerobic carbon-monoxide dehydrogenase small subunit